MPNVLFSPTCQWRWYIYNYDELFALPFQFFFSNLLCFGGEPYVRRNVHCCRWHCNVLSILGVRLRLCTMGVSVPVWAGVDVFALCACFFLSSPLFLSSRILWGRQKYLWIFTCHVGIWTAVPPPLICWVVFLYGSLPSAALSLCPELIFLLFVLQAI